LWVVEMGVVVAVCVGVGVSIEGVLVGGCEDLCGRLNFWGCWGRFRRCAAEFRAGIAQAHY
jgi:hypothetical protein